LEKAGSLFGILPFSFLIVLAVLFKCSKERIGEILGQIVGPGAKQAELWLQFVPVVLAGLAVPLYASIKGLGWTAPQFIIATLLTTDNDSLYLGYFSPHGAFVLATLIIF